MDELVVAHVVPPSSRGSDESWTAGTCAPAVQPVVTCQAYPVPPDVGGGARSLCRRPARASNSSRVDQRSTSASRRRSNSASWSSVAATTSESGWRSHTSRPTGTLSRSSMLLLAVGVSRAIQVRSGGIAGLPGLRPVEDVPEERQCGRTVLLPAGLDLVGRQDEPALQRGGRAELDGERGHVVLAVNPIRGVARRRIQLGRLLRGIGPAMDSPDEPLHLLGQLAHGAQVGLVLDRAGGVAPWVEDQLGIAVVGEHTAEQLTGDEVAHRAGLRLGERSRADVGVVTGHVAGRVDVQHAPHVAVVAVGVHADAAVGVAAAVHHGPSPPDVVRVGAGRGRR